jgi:hypothetical protein
MISIRPPMAFTSFPVRDDKPSAKVPTSCIEETPSVSELRMVPLSGRRVSRYYRGTAGWGNCLVAAACAKRMVTKNFELNSMMMS